MKERIVYLNNAATAWPRAPGVAESVALALLRIPEHPGRGGKPFGELDPVADAMDDCRNYLAAMLSVHDPSRIALCSNATSALNLALLGQNWDKYSRVITTVTEHNSVLRPLAHLKKIHGFDLCIVGLDSKGALDADAFDAALEDGADLVVMNHASNVTGRIQDVRRFFTRAHDHGAVTLLDASQTLGHMPVHPEFLQADLVAFTGHKALRGPPGTGGLYVSPSIEPGQVFTGGTGSRSDLQYHPPEMPVRLEAGTPNVPAFAGLSVALQWLDREGYGAHIAEKHLTGMLLNGLCEIDGVQVLDADPDAERVPLVSFRIPGWPVEDCGCILGKSYGIVCRCGLHCAPLIHAAIGSAPDGTVRFSPSMFTTEEEIEYTIDSVRMFAGATGVSG